MMHGNSNIKKKVFIYVTSLHVSSNPVLNIRRMELYQYITLCRWLPGMPVRKFLPDWHTRQSPTQSDNTR